MKKTNTFNISNVIISLLLVVFLSLVSAIILPNFKQIEYRKFLNLNESILTNFQGTLISSKSAPIYKEEIDEIFIPVDIISKYIDKYIFWDEAEGKLTITTENNVIRMNTEELKYFVNDKLLELDIPVYNIETTAYIPSSFLKDFYNLSIDFDKTTQIVSINFLKNDKTLAKVKKDKAKVRFKPNKKSEIIKTSFLDETLLILETSSDKYTKVMTKEGYIGYILSKNLSESFVEKGKILENPPKTNKTVWKAKKGKINLVFDQISNVTANSTLAKRTAHSGVDVLVPTWFSFENEKGDIKNIADKGYVNWAHENGYQVWGLITDNFNSKISHAVLSSTEIREHVIKQILAFVSLYNLDGINIDFESVPKTDGKYFVQFFRELAPLLREQGAVLSADLFVPKSWTHHYNREEISKIADYLIVMGYDEHYAGSKTSGTVASISWSKEAIVNTLAQNVPKEKLVLGVPFYTRIWKEENINGSINLSSKAYGMQDAYDFMIEKGGSFTWLEDMGQYYSEVNENNITYKVWLEDENSMTKRIDLAIKHDIAGVGAWKRGLEKPLIWDLLEKKLKS